MGGLTVIGGRKTSAMDPLAAVLAVAAAHHGVASVEAAHALGLPPGALRLDFLDVELPIVVEVQSERYHAALLDSQADRRRLSDLVAAGDAVVEVWDIEVWHRPDDVVAVLRDARRALRLGSPPRIWRSTARSEEENVGGVSAASCGAGGR